MRIAELMAVPHEDHDIAWLRKALQSAIELEFSTIPPYLCAMWSIRDDSSRAYKLIQEIVVEEMFHMALACNMLTCIGGSPTLNTAETVPKYPSQLPGNVRPTVRVALAALSKDVVKDVFMEIEYPVKGPIVGFELVAETFPTIGDFYNAIQAAFEALDPSAFKGERQIERGSRLPKLTKLDDVVAAIKVIRNQGEGSSDSPYEREDTKDLAHYYRFASLYHGREPDKDADGKWGYTGAPIDFPDIFPMLEVPAGGYPESEEFDKDYTGMLDALQAAWDTGDASKLGVAVGIMRLQLGDKARLLMQDSAPGGGGNLGPSFKLVR